MSDSSQVLQVMHVAAVGSELATSTPASVKRRKRRRARQALRKVLGASAEKRAGQGTETNETS